MRRSLALAAGLALLTTAVRGDDTIPPDTVVAVKHATVFVRVQGTDWKATGSGFVIVADREKVLIATNYHVVAPPDYETKPRPAPADFVKSLKVPAVTVVFDGGTKMESSAKAEIIAADAVNDLAILRVTGLKDPPKPIEFVTPPKLVETMGVYTFGYPFGQALATGKGAPAITVGKASVSSLRYDDDGELAVVQIDGALNPGNSGGPVVDTKGKLVGVAVATIRDGQGIGFAVPSAELGKLMKGRLDGFHVTATKAADGKLVVKAEVGVHDPNTAVRTVTLHYVVVPPKGAKPKAGEALAKHAGVKKVVLKVANGVATGELIVDAAEGDLFVQAVPDGAAGATGSTRVGSYGLTAPKAGGAVALGPVGSVPAGAGAGEVPAPPGWKEYTSTNKLYMCWLPEKIKGRSEKQNNVGKPPRRLHINTLHVDLPNGSTFLVEQVIITPIPRFTERESFMKLLREVAIGDAPGARVTRERDTKMGRFPGKEYLIEKGRAASRARTFVIGSSLYLVRVLGTRSQVESPESTIFLDSVRLQIPNRPAPGGPQGPIVGGPPKADATKSVIAGGGTHPEFKELAPAGGMLVGLEVGLGKIGPNTAVKAVRAIYSTNGKESFGEWHGPTAASVITEKVKVLAKPGYAVGRIEARTGTGIFGFSVTFMKVVDGKLKPEDNYESDWLGAAIGFGPLKVDGKGELAIGFAGKKNADTLAGIGLVFADTAKKGPQVGVGPMPPQKKNPEVGIAPGVPAPVRPGQRGPRIQGGGGNAEFRDHAPTGGYLVGFELGMGKFVNRPVIKAVRPIYRVGNKESQGEQFGTELNDVVKVVAKPGYAVGVVTVKTSLNIDGMKIVFMKLADGKLDPSDSYETEWVAGTSGFPAVKIGDGTPVVGILVKASAKDAVGLGLIYTDTNKPGLDGPWPAGKPTRMQGGGGDPEFREAGPDGSLLVGLEVGVGRFFNNPVVVSVRPIFRAGNKETEGEWHGTTKADAVKEVVKVVAKPGYAIGALTAKTGLGMDGLSVTFMKVVNGKLDPNDSYESDWVGGKGGGGPVKVGGDGTAIIGLIGKARADTVSGLGLLQPADKKK